jgi:tRNA pseudouridine13 synthase
VDESTHVVPSVYLTADLPGIGGRLKVRPDDFLVEEQPAYQPSGEGEHIYLFVQKTGLSTMEMIRIVARHFGVRNMDVGYAGLKDKHAVTRQVLSVHTPKKKPEDFPKFEHPKIMILWTDQHANKLRRGHLRSNWFSIRVRDVSPTDVLRAKKIMDRLALLGVPNRIGEQRFGLLENNHLIGRAIITGDYEGAVRELLAPNARMPHINVEARRLYSEGKYLEAMTAYPRDARPERAALEQLARGKNPSRAVYAIGQDMLSFYISAFQSAVFNRVLDERVEAGRLSTLEAGDVAIKHGNEALFDVDEAVAADPTTPTRLASFEISPSGPMWGGMMKRGAGACDAADVAALQSLGVLPEQISSYDGEARVKLDGKRRALRVPVINPEVEGGVDEHGAYVRCAFELPKGAFATVVMREIMKPPAGVEGAEEP